MGRFWKAMPLLLLAACGSPTAKSTPVEPAPAAPQKVATQPAAPAADDHRDDITASALADLRSIADELCLCPDTACIDAATEKIEKLGQKYSTVTFEARDDAKHEAQDIIMRMSQCAARITTGRRKRPKLPGEP